MSAQILAIGQEESRGRAWKIDLLGAAKHGEIEDSANQQSKAKQAFSKQRLAHDQRENDVWIGKGL